MVKRIALLGSTGSIGKQVLDVVKNNPGHFQIVVLSAQISSEKLIEQALEFEPKAVVIGCENSFETVRSALRGKNIAVYTGIDDLNSIVERDDVDLVLVALVGFAGLKPTINAIKNGKNVALANKESLVVAGEMLTNLAKKNNVKIIPVDSEHSAIFQCLRGERTDNIEKIYLTASGGPFLGKGKDFLQYVTPEHALQHPKWEMGAKITIDSASLMNKGLEVIEAKWLFNLNVDQIEVLIHPQSVIHSIVQFIDGSMKAQMGPPDMRLPIQFALSYPARISSTFPRFDFSHQSNLSFYPPDRETFPNLGLAYEALAKKGNMPCILNAANEVAVESFLSGKVGFLQITDLIEHCMEKISFIENPDFEELVQTNKQTKAYAQNLVKYQFKA
ncbi:MAG: 1-deoxy-D-xylulose-5-phosphate reductoisomerase [Bacteroidales bacterium]|nr:1-deoxy-D-xylulose-5-phosphate reductoisomerase [Bacteroidales bacterium]